MTDAERTILIGLIPRETLIVYEANALTTHVTIFTDSEYPPCSKLREWVPKLTSYGVEVRYAGAPRKEPYPEMMSIWCASDRRKPRVVQVSEPAAIELPSRTSAEGTRT